MKIIYSVFLFLSLFLKGYSQTSVEKYKLISDNAIRGFFHKKIFKKVKCESFYAQGIQMGESYAGGYDTSKSKLINAKAVAIFYQLYSDYLGYEFEFYVSIDSNKIAYVEGRGYEDIPPCVAKRKKCNFISSEIALNIAKKDSIKFENNLLVEFRKSKKTNQFVWVVSGQDINLVRYGIRPVDGWPLFPKNKDNTRIIDAISGDLMDVEEFISLEEK